MSFSRSAAGAVSAEPRRGNARHGGARSARMRGAAVRAHVWIGATLTTFSRQTRQGTRRSGRFEPSLLNQAWVCPSWVFGFQPTQRLELQRRCPRIDRGRQRSKQGGQGQTSPKGRRWFLPGRTRETPSSSECGTSGTHPSAIEAGESQHLRHFSVPNERELGRNATKSSMIQR